MQQELDPPKSRIFDMFFKELFDIQPKSKDPLHGITLEMILTQLVQQYGWLELARRIPSAAFITSRASNPA